MSLQRLVLTFTREGVEERTLTAGEISADAAKAPLTSGAA
jgi:hypothetical protein